MDADRGSPLMVILNVSGATPRAVASSWISAMASASVRGPGPGMGVRVGAVVGVVVGGGALVAVGKGAWQLMLSQQRIQKTTPTAAMCLIYTSVPVSSFALQFDSKLETRLTP